MEKERMYPLSMLVQMTKERKLALLTGTIMDLKVNPYLQRLILILNKSIHVPQLRGCPLACSSIKYLLKTWDLLSCHLPNLQNKLRWSEEDCCQKNEEMFCYFVKTLSMIFNNVILCELIDHLCMIFCISIV